MPVTVARLLRRGDRYDFEFDEIAPSGHPWLEEQRVVALHQLIAAVEVCLDPAIDIREARGHQAAFFLHVPIHGGGVAIAKSLDHHEQHCRAPENRRLGNFAHWVKSGNLIRFVQGIWNMRRSARPFVVSVALVLCVAIDRDFAASADVRVAFDIPASIECRDVTPAKCAAEHPNLKAIEGKFRVSARINKGTEAEIVDFLYMLVSPSLSLKIHDYLPNTTLESALADDRIEVAETAENAATTNEDVHVGYKILSLGGSKNQSSKKTESNHYHQIVPKALVLASGTTNREHGVFFKLRPSNGASLEGAKEFSFLAIVPRNWRGDWCTVACAARAKKKSLLPSGMVLAGIEQAHVGLYLSGDREGAALAEILFQIQGSAMPTCSPKS